MISGSGLSVEGRIGEVKRVTKETNVSVKINLDGSSVADSSTGIPFLDHMLDVSVSYITIALMFQSSVSFNQVWFLIICIVSYCSNLLHMVYLMFM